MTSERMVRIVGGALLLAGYCWVSSDGGSSRAGVVQNGNLAARGGTATVRTEFEPAADDAATTNDESNDQPVGHFGSVTIEVTSAESGHTYTLDAEVDGMTLERIYFPKGGWVDFPDCEIDEDLCGDCEDEQGRSWTFEGEGSGVSSGWYEDDTEANQMNLDEPGC